MSIQSTIELTREQAEEQWVDKQLKSPDLKRKLQAIALNMSDKDLENELEEHFYNYLITS